MRSVIIDGKDYSGKRASASVPKMMFDLLVVQVGTYSRARSDLRHVLSQRSDLYSQACQEYILRKVVKPRLIHLLDGPDGPGSKTDAYTQIDIEDY